MTSSHSLRSRTDDGRKRTQFSSALPYRGTFVARCCLHSKMVLLRDLLLQPTWSPLTNNIAATFVMIAYFRAAIELTGWLRIRFGKSSEYRQILHVIISSLVVFWPLFDTSDWSWRFNAMVPAVMFSRLVYKVNDSIVCFDEWKCGLFWWSSQIELKFLFVVRAPCSKIPTTMMCRIFRVLLHHLI